MKRKAQPARAAANTRGSQVTSAWEAEIKKRIDELESGVVKSIPWNTARRQIFAPRRKS